MGFIWDILSFLVGGVVALALSPLLAARTGLPLWLLVVVLIVDVFLVVRAPITVHEHYAAWSENRAEKKHWGQHGWYREQEGRTGMQTLWWLTFLVIGPLLTFVLIVLVAGLI